MTWVKLDDAFWRNRKIRRAWREPRAIGFYVMAITYSADHELDGRVDPEWVTDQLPHTRERNRVLDVLHAAGLFHEHPEGGYEIHDFLFFNRSREENAAVRAVKARAGAAGGRARQAKHRAKQGARQSVKQDPQHDDKQSARQGANHDAQQKSSPLPVNDKDNSLKPSARVNVAGASDHESGKGLAA